MSKKPDTDYYYKFQYNLFWGAPDVAEMPYFAQNLYWRILDLMYRGKHLPDDTKKVAKTLKAPHTHIVRYWSDVRRKFDVDGNGLLTHHRVAFELLQRGKGPGPESPPVVLPEPEETKVKKKAEPIKAPTPIPVKEIIERKEEPVTEHPTRHPMYPAWKEQFNRYAALTKMSLDSTALSKWAQVCSELVTTPDDLQQLVWAVDTLKEECNARPEKRSHLKYPPYFIRDDRPDKKGEQQWLTYASNVEEVQAKAELKRPPPFVLENVPWLTFDYGTSEARKQQVAGRWTEDLRRAWIEERLARVPVDHHASWYEKHGLTPIESAQPAA